MINNLDITIWGRTFSLPVDYDCFEYETATSEQKEALENFLCHPAWLDNAKPSVKNYYLSRIIEKNDQNIDHDIFKYVKPDYIFIKRESGYPRVSIMCNYYYDPEHGLAIVFQHDGRVTVGIQDIIL